MAEERTMESRAYDVATVAVEPSTTLASGVIRIQFMAWLPEGFIQPKLAGFISQHECRVVHASPDEFHLRMGHRRLFPWSRRGEDFLLEVTVKVNPLTPCPRGMTHVTADMRSRDRRAPRDVVQARCRQLGRDLRYWLMGQNLEVCETP